MSSNPTDPYLERVKAEIRAEAEAARQREPLPRRDFATADRPERIDAERIDRARNDYSIAELTGAHYSAFVDQAFRAVLKRAPDDGGSETQVLLLAAGASKAEVLGNLRYSSEGRRIGVRVRGLLPRYAMAKLGRVPVIGFLFNWLLALAALPLMLRHQRAADTQSAAHFDRVRDHLRNLDENFARAAAEHQALSERLDGLRAEVGTLRAYVDTVQDRTSALEARAGRAEDRLQQLPELRHSVHAINHWWVSVRRSLDEIDQAAQAGSERAQTLAAAAYASPDAAAARDARLSSWLPVFAQSLAVSANVLDLGSADGERLAQLSGIVGETSGIEANPFLARRARERGLNVAVGDPSGALARCADASVDAIVASASILRTDAELADFLTDACRALKPRGWLAIDFASALNAPDLLATPLVDREALKARVQAAGFAVHKAIGAAGDAAIVAQSP